MTEELKADQLDDREAIARPQSPYPDPSLIDELMTMFADPYVDGLTHRAAAEIARLDAIIARQQPRDADHSAEAGKMVGDAEPCFECGSTERVGTACKPCNPELVGDADQGGEPVWTGPEAALTKEEAALISRLTELVKRFPSDQEPDDTPVDGHLTVKQACDLREAVRQLGRDRYWKRWNDRATKALAPKPSEARPVVKECLTTEAPAVVEGWRLVPGEADGMMDEAGTRVANRTYERGSYDVRAAYRAMLAAAPSPPPPTEREEVLEAEVARLTAILNTPEVANFVKGVMLEAPHQRERYGADHNAGKTPLDWFWLIGYLAQKAATAEMHGDADKAMHHTISTAAALANWHAAISGTNTHMRPGIDAEARGLALLDKGARGS